MDGHINDAARHHTRVLERFGEQAAALDGEAGKAEASASQLRQIIANGAEQRGAIADDIAALERRLRERRSQLTVMDEDLGDKNGTLEDLQRDAVDYRAEAAAVRAIVSREAAQAPGPVPDDTLLVSAQSAITTSTDRPVSQP